MPIPVGARNHYRDQPVNPNGAAYNGMNGMERQSISNGYGPGQSLYRNSNGPGRSSGQYSSGYGDPRDDPRIAGHRPSQAEPQRPIQQEPNHPIYRNPLVRRSVEERPEPQRELHREGSREGQRDRDRVQSQPLMEAERNPQIDVYVQQGRFPIEHLCTVTMDRKEGLISVEDVIRKVQKLDAKGQIWSQFVELTIADRDVKFIDAATRGELEVFPMNDVSLVSAELNQCNYDSLLIIQIKFSGEKHPQSYVFQCDQVPAEVIAKELQKNIDYAHGRRKRTTRPETRPDHRHASNYQDRQMYIPPPPDEPAPLPPTEGNVRNKVAAFAAAAAMAQASGNNVNRGFQYPKSTPMRNSESDEPLELIAMRTERDVEILNHCFDEIEAFIGLLQKAAEAYTELVRRRKARKSKKREPGDGLLLARSRPPPESEYIECFKKFKYCFNLLARLKNHIHDPNAPELIHFLMVPLELIIKSCQGTDLAANIVSPLLTPQSVDLLTNCLTSRETDLWKSLGRAWNVPSTEWPKERPVPRYTPYFHDGWSPPPLPDHPSLEVNAAVAASAAAVARGEHRDRVPSGSDYSDGVYNGNKRNSNSSSVSDQLRPSTSRSQDNPPVVFPKPQVNTPLPPGVKGFVKPLFDFVARNVKELTIMSGEKLELLEDNRKWWKVRNSSGQYGYVPSTILTAITPNQQQQQQQQQQPARNPNFNSNHHAPSPQSPPTPPLLGASTSFDQSFNSSNSMQQRALNQAPPPPPPPPGPAPAPVPLRENNSLDFATQLKNTLRKKELQRRGVNVEDLIPNRAEKTHTDLHEELMKRVNQGPPRNFNVRRSTGASVNINYVSSADDVTKWLQSKGFSKLTVDSLGVLTGAQLFSLTKEELRQVCFDDANRVYSQLMVQKSGLEDQSNTSSELKAIMHRRKVQSDSDNSNEQENSPFNSPPPDFSPAAPPGT
ncbi:epidermal growth factor receptor kinase substrate 8-like protein 2 isoform X2 [Acanthaster planci]|uniref:Epidermal growth factor receptor kinase substrate 8-like protein 2 isoform X2 n=1 Tax=Acanthaster planci TaxID=133434 RepID=A0A8B7YRE2_ACAPL|nr:epidermal growth factor receptor kinase substrate 8-like protein 2 isoform X2 [Acanthaster planci]